MVSAAMPAFLWTCGQVQKAWGWTRDLGVQIGEGGADSWRLTSARISALSTRVPGGEDTAGQQPGREQMARLLPCSGQAPLTGLAPSREQGGRLGASGEQSLVTV